MAFASTNVGVEAIDTDQDTITIGYSGQTTTFPLAQLRNLITGDSDRSEGYKYLFALRLSADGVDMSNPAAIVNSIQASPFDL